MTAIESGSLSTSARRPRIFLGPNYRESLLWLPKTTNYTPFEEQVRLDIKYIAGRSLRTDIGLLLRTIPAVLFARGAY
jgi:lipopolysaccharide/colanic/teichoic acid biosynthesis glycosyltransferase